MIELVNKYGPKKWSTIAQHLPGRIGKQCRERYGLVSKYLMTVYPCNLVRLTGEYVMTYEIYNCIFRIFWSISILIA